MANKTAWRDVSIILRKQVQEPVYEFLELSEEVQNALISEEVEKREKDWDFFNLDFIVDDFIEELHQKYHFSAARSKVFYQVGFCQSDGAEFSGQFEDSGAAIDAATEFGRFTPEEAQALKENIYDVNMMNRDFVGGVSFCCEWNEEEGKDTLPDELQDRLHKALRDWKYNQERALYAALRDECEYQISEDAARYFLIDSGYYFADGTGVSGHVA